MPERGQDIRIAKTHKTLQNAMYNLLAEKSFRRITVNDICAEAMVSRSTFYLHFEDKYKLLLFCMREYMRRMNDAARSMPLPDFLRMALNEIYEHRTVFRNFMKSETDVELFDMFRSCFHDHVTGILEETVRQGVKLPGSLPALAAFYASGLTGMVIWWVESDFSLPIEAMASAQVNLFAEMLPPGEGV